MGSARLCVMPDPPVDPLEDAAAGARCGEDGPGEQVADRLDGDAELWRAVHEGPAARRRLLSFRFPAAGSTIDGQIAGCTNYLNPHARQCNTAWFSPCSKRATHAARKK